MNQTKIYIGILFLIISTTKLLSADKTDDFIFKIHPAKNDHLYIDVKGWHYSAEKKGGTIQLYEMDNGIDRLIKVIPCPNSPQYVYLQPMHSNYIMGLDRTSGNIKLMDKNPQKDRMFELIPVMGKKETYNIKIGNKYIDAEVKSNGCLKIENSDKKIHTEWVFNATNTLTAAPYPIISNSNLSYKLISVSNTSLFIDASTYYSGIKEVRFLNKKNPFYNNGLIKLSIHNDSVNYISIRSKHTNLKLIYGINSRIEYSEHNSEIKLKPTLIFEDSVQHYFLQSKKNKLYLTLDRHTSSLSFEEYTGEDNQKWIFEPEQRASENKGQYIYTIQNRNNRNYMDLKGYERDNNKELRVSNDSKKPKDWPDGYFLIKGMVHTKRYNL